MQAADALGTVTHQPRKFTLRSQPMILSQISGQVGRPLQLCGKRRQRRFFLTGDDLVF